MMGRALSLDLVEQLAEPKFMLGDYSVEDWKDSSLIEPLARVAALLEVDGREVPDAIRKASEVDRPGLVAVKHCVRVEPSRPSLPQSTWTVALLAPSVSVSGNNAAERRGSPATWE
jgi:hypothetical protein